MQEIELPELTDEWVAENLGEFETVDEWRDSIRERIAPTKLNQARNQFVGRVTEALAGLVDIEPPESMVQSDLQASGAEHRAAVPGARASRWSSGCRSPVRTAPSSSRA